MDINETIEKYLTENDKKSDLVKVQNVVNSAKNIEQIETAANMVINYYKMYGAEEDTNGLKRMLKIIFLKDGWTDERGKMQDLIFNKMEKMTHEKGTITKEEYRKLKKIVDNFDKKTYDIRNTMEQEKNYSGY